MIRNKALSTLLLTTSAGAAVFPHCRSVERESSHAASSPPTRVERVAEPPPAPLPSAALPRYATLDGPAKVSTPAGKGVTLLPGSGLDRRSPPPLITVLHGMCLSAEENCSFVGAIAEGRAILVCPEGNATCGDRSASWDGLPKVRAAYVHAGVAAAQSALDEDTDPLRGDVLFGSSRGAFVARDVIYEGTQGRWAGVVLVGAAIVLDPDKVRRAGVRRVLLAAPDFDGAAPTMRRAQAVLCGAGLPARSWRRRGSARPRQGGGRGARMGIRIGVRIGIRIGVRMGIRMGVRGSPARSTT